jgi:hypothetical protein
LGIAEEKMKKKTLAVIVCLTLGFGLAACREKAQKAKVETIEGVTYVHNPVVPLHPGKTVVFEEELAYKEKDERGETRLFNPGRVAVDAQGNAYIEDQSDTSIKVFDPAGKFLRAIGRKGEGPGEFADIGEIIPLSDGRVLVTDSLARRTSFFGPEGQFLSSLAWKKLFQRVYLASASSYTLEEAIYEEESRGIWIKTIDFLGEELTVFGKFSLPELKTYREEGGMTLLPVPWSPASIFAGDQKRQWLYHCPGDKYEIGVYDQKGKLFRKIDRPYERIPVMSKDIRDFRARFDDKPESPLARYYEQMEFPKVKAIANRLIVDSDGNLWVLTSELKKEGDKEIAAYDIFNPGGFYEARIWSDVRPSVFAGGKMYLTDEDEATGLRQVKRYRIVWKEG